MTSSKDIDWERLRASEFAGLGDAVYLNAASLAPLPRRSRVATAEFNDRRTRVQDMGEEDFTASSGDARAACARLINARPDEIALGANTSYGINLAASGLHLPSGSTVLISDREFPANVYPWMQRDAFRLEVVAVTEEGWPDEEKILNRIHARDVAALSISSVQFATGYHADLDRLGNACRETGTLLIVDAIQSLGCLPIDVQQTPIDILATGGHKWLLGPLGVGFAFVRMEIQNRITPVHVGWSSMEASQDFDHLLDYRYDFVDNARRFEVATAPLQDHRALTSSINLLLETGVGRIRQRVEDLLSPLRDWATDSNAVRVVSPPQGRHSSGIFAFRPPRVEAAFQRLTDAGVICSLREGSIRIAPHLYNREADIERVLEVMKAAEASGWS